MWLTDVLFPPAPEDIERAENDLIERFGPDAAREAARLAGVCKRVGSRANARIYRRVARRLASQSAVGREVSHG